MNELTQNPEPRIQNSEPRIQNPQTQNGSPLKWDRTIVVILTNNNYCRSFDAAKRKSISRVLLLIYGSKMYVEQNNEW